MEIKIPQQHNFDLSLESFRKYNVEPEWEIGVSPKDDIAWSIVLSYLISADYSTNEFERRLKTLTGADENAKAAKKAIYSFNPFKNRFTCFLDETLKQIVSIFKRKLRWQSFISVSDKLLAASDFLNCFIVLIRQTNDKVETVSYPKNAEERNEAESRDVITLFASPVTGEELRSSDVIYTFMIGHQLGSKLKCSALSYFLREAGLSKKHISQVMTVMKNDNQFLISILESHFRTVLSEIYNLPYIVTKLAEAGYETDPKSTDIEDRSGLFYAVIKADTKLLYQLYFCAVNSCFASKGTYRNPDWRVVCNLHEIEKVLQNDSLKLNYFKDVKSRDKFKNSFDQLLGLNKFLIDITSKILNTREKLNENEKVSDKEFEAIKRRDIILSILETYETFFDSAKPEKANPCALEDYIKCRQYYYSIDVTATICFFDNIIYLKERLSLENNIFSAMEEKFLFLILCQTLFDEVTTKDMPLHMVPSVNDFYAFPLMQRQDVTCKIKEFKEILQNTIISSGINLVESIPKREIYSVLHYHPVIKDNLEFSRLKYYLHTAICVKVINTKSVMVIERALQVLGEYMKPEPDNNFSVLRRIFPLCLPNNTAHILRRIRNELSHLEGHKFPSKFESEKNYFLFQSIQNEIFSINMHFMSVYEIQDLREALYGIEQFENAWKRMKNSKNLYGSEYPIFIDKDMLPVSDEWLKYFGKSYIRHFTLIFKTILFNLQDKLPKISINTLRHITDKLRPLEFLLELSVKFPLSISKHTSTLLEMFRLIEHSNSDIDLNENIYNVMGKCKKFLSKFKDPKEGNKFKNAVNCKIFLTILRGKTYLSPEEKDEIRKEIPLSVKESVKRKERIITSINNGFSLNIDEHFTEFEISYLSKKKMKSFTTFYRDKNIRALDILKIMDPIAELEEVLLKNSINKNNYEPLCHIMEFSKRTKKKLRNLISGPRKKPVVNKLSILQIRIQLLTQTLIKDNKDIAEQWGRIKSERSQQHFVNKVSNLLLEDEELLASVEMLLFDCMILFENERSLKHMWIKSSKLYSGFNLRNVISHGNPLLECLCKLLDPGDLLTAMICKMLWLIENEETVVSILELYKRAGSDSTKLDELMNMTGHDEHSELRYRIRMRRKSWEFEKYTCPENDKREEWEKFILLIPGNSTSNAPQNGKRPSEKKKNSKCYRRFADL